MLAHRFFRHAQRVAAAGPVVAALLLTACSGSSSDDPLEAAKAALSQQNPDAALVHLQNAIAATPNSAEGRLLLGRTLLQVGNFSAAVVELRRARELKADENVVVPLLAEALQKLGQDKLLVDQFGTVALSDPKAAARLAAVLALTYMDQGRGDKARETLDNALKTTPDEPHLMLSMARLKAARGNTQAALADAEALVKAHPSFDAAWTFRGSLLERTGKKAEALASFAKASEINPRQPEAWFARAMIALADNDAKAAREAQDKLRRVWGTNPNAVYLEARLLGVEGKHEQARPIFDRLLNAAPDSVPVLVASALNEIKLQSFVQAEAQLARAVSLAPQDPGMRTLLAQVQLRLRRPDKAWNSIAQTLDAAEPATATLVVAAQAKLLQGEPVQAEQLFRRASAKGSTDTEVRTALASGLLGIKGQEEAALRELRQLAMATTQPDADLRVIGALLARRSFDEAIAAIGALEKKTPGDPANHELRGQALLGKNELDAARGAFQEALKLDPGYAPAVVKLTELDMAAGKVEAARDRARAAVKANPKSGNLLTLLATLEARAGAPSSEVLQLLEQATRVDGDNLNSWMTLMMRHFNAADLAAALAAAESANKAIPENVQILDATGRIQLASGNSNQALQTFSELVRVAPKSMAGYLGQVNALNAMGNTEGAARAAQRLLEISPDSALARRVIADVAVTRRRFDEAMAMAKAVQKQSPDLAGGFIMEGQIAEAQGKRSAAIAAYRVALSKRDVQDTPVRLHRLLLISGDKSEARAAADDWLRAQPKDVMFMSYLGDTELEAGAPEEALRWYERALQINPKTVAALNNSAVALTKTKNYAKAMERVRQALAIQPSNPDILDTLAQVHASQKQYSEAAAALRKAIARATNPAPLQLSLARVLRSNGEAAAATTELQSIIDKGRTHPNFAEARKLLTEIQKGS